MAPSNSLARKATLEYAKTYRFFGNELTFHHQAARFENWEEFEPEREDWDTLERLATNKHQRGKVSDKHMKLVKARGRKF